MAVLPSSASKAAGVTVVYYVENADKGQYVLRIWHDGASPPKLEEGALSPLPDWLEPLVCYGKLGGHGKYTSSPQHYLLWMEVDEHNRLIRFLSL